MLNVQEMDSPHQCDSERFFQSIFFRAFFFRVYTSKSLPLPRVTIRLLVVKQGIQRNHGGHIDAHRKFLHRQRVCPINLEMFPCSSCSLSKCATFAKTFPETMSTMTSQRSLRAFTRHISTKALPALQSKWGAVLDVSIEIKNDIFLCLGYSETEEAVFAHHGHVVRQSPSHTINFSASHQLFGNNHAHITKPFKTPL